MLKNQIFFKTVRFNGDSVWANDKFNVNYQIGKRYRFPKKFPAHVFRAYRHCSGPENFLIDTEEIYNNRREGGAGNRVLVCIGNLANKMVPRFEITDKVWDITTPQKDWPKEYIWTSTDFIVVGEIALPQSYHGSRPVETPKYKTVVVGLKSKVLVL